MRNRENITTSEGRTNFERVTESVEALTEFAVETLGISCVLCPVLDEDCNDTNIECKKIFKKWLNEESEEPNG